MTAHMGNADHIRREVDDLLRAWEAGDRDARAVWEAAERVWSAHEWDAEPADDIVAEVVGLLDALPQQLVVAQDVPAIRRFLGAATGDATAAWTEWTAYWDAVDLPARAARLSSDPLYGPTT